MVWEVWVHHFSVYLQTQAKIEQPSESTFQLYQPHKPVKKHSRRQHKTSIQETLRCEKAWLNILKKSVTYPRARVKWTLTSYHIYTNQLKTKPKPLNAGRSHEHSQTEARGKASRTLNGLSHDNNFWDLTSKAQSNKKEKIEKSDYIKIKNSSASKDRSERQNTEGKRYLQIHTSDMGLLFKTYKELLKQQETQRTLA